MAGVSITAALETNTGLIDLERMDLTAAVYVRMSSVKDTGAGVLAYMIANGYGYGSIYNVGNDTVVNAVIYQIDPPQLVPGSCHLWKAIARYRELTPEEKTLNNEMPVTPVDRRPRISSSTVIREVPVLRAIYRGGFDAAVGLTDGDVSPIINSAKAVLVPQPVKPKSNRVITIERNMAAVTLNDTAYPTDFINNDEVTISDRKTTVIAKEYTLKHLSWSTSPAYEEGLDFVKVVGEFEIQESGWRREYLDEGLHRKAEPGGPDGKGGTYSMSQFVEGVPFKARIQDVMGMPIVEPVRLDGNGQPLDDDDESVYSEWSVEDEIDITTLPFFAGIIAT